MGRRQPLDLWVKSWRSTSLLHTPGRPREIWSKAPGTSVKGQIEDFGSLFFSRHNVFIRPKPATNCGHVAITLFQWKPFQGLLERLWSLFGWKKMTSGYHMQLMGLWARTMDPLSLSPFQDRTTHSSLSPRSGRLSSSPGLKWTSQPIFGTVLYT